MKTGWIDLFIKEDTASMHNFIMNLSGNLKMNRKKYQTKNILRN